MLYNINVRFLIKNVTFGLVDVTYATRNDGYAISIFKQKSYICNSKIGKNIINLSMKNANSPKQFSFFTEDRRSLLI